ncbi:MAG TPA: VWA domain-containing protein [Vicinamibacterales bacterium]|jgi:VWFA-related protein|nr:VWA domain-containing protein [Vicinamibacterales bacterium]
MRTAAKFLTAGAFALLIAIGAPPTPKTVLAQAGVQPSQTPTFRASVDLITTDMIPRDSRTDQFLADLKPNEIEIYEDGVKQEIVSFVLTHGGRVFNMQAPPPAPVQEGIILPQRRPTNDAAGRIFLIFIDDFHLQFRETPRTRLLIQKMLRLLIHDGDMFGIVSTGHSSISEQLTYDRQVLESAVERITGGGLTPKEITEGMQSSQGPQELRHRAHVAFSTAYDLMRNLEKVQNRRKAVIYISSGYDFDPFVEGRLEEQARRLGIDETTDERGDQVNAAEQLRKNQDYKDLRSQQELAATDLYHELYDLIKAANRANATLYTIDPRGLVAGPDIDQDVKASDWNAYIRETQDSLRILAENTGGIAIVNQNDFDKGLKRIDNETSDYYVLGYYSSNPDPLRRTRRLEVRTTRPGVTIRARETYSLRPNQTKK